MIEVRCDAEHSNQGHVLVTILTGLGLVANNKVFIRETQAEDIALYENEEQIAHGFDDCLEYLCGGALKSAEEWFNKIKEASYDLNTKPEYIAELNDKFSAKACDPFILGKEVSAIDFAVAGALREFVKTASPQDKARFKFALALYSKVRKTEFLKKPEAPQRPVEDISRLKLIVGEIKEVWRHPDSAKLYCERIDIGEEQPREIASGLQEFVPIEEMKGAKVIVLANLKARNLGGFSSHGMVMCASNDDHSAVELLSPGPSAQIGDLVTFEGYPNPQTPDEFLSNKKGQDPLPVLLPNLRTGADCQSYYKDHKMVIRGEPVTCKSLANAHIS